MEERRHRGGCGWVRLREKDNSSRGGNTTHSGIREEDSVETKAGRGREGSAKLHPGEEPRGLEEVWGLGRES